MEEHERRRKPILPRCLIPPSLPFPLPYAPFRPTLLLHQPTHGLAPPSSDDLLDDFEERCKSLTIHTVFVEAGLVERAKVVEVREVGRGERCGGSGRED